MFSQIRFSKLLQAIPRHAFNKAVQNSGADRYAKRFSSWDLLVTMIFGQVNQIQSLRTLTTAFEKRGLKKGDRFIFLHAHAERGSAAPCL